MYGSHHQQPQNHDQNDVLDPFLVVKEPSMMHAIHGQHSYRPDPTQYIITGPELVLLRVLIVVSNPLSDRCFESWSISLSAAVRICSAHANISGRRTSRLNPTKRGRFMRWREAKSRAWSSQTKSPRGAAPLTSSGALRQLLSRSSCSRYAPTTRKKMRCSVVRVCPPVSL